ncbi:serine hydrolase domain-containing protein [Streptosporangium amethystogenes]|uniref:serine hydrolase domain-containing protein n=1 Tax=Streptosporangium amethystogenes TaxID=2002 RepID=UPI0037A90E7C
MKRVEARKILVGESRKRILRSATDIQSLVEPPIQEAHVTLLSRRSFLQASTAMVPAAVFGAPPVRAGSVPAVEVSGVAPTALAGFDRVLKTYITERDISCAQLAIVKNGKLVLARGYRYSSDGRAVPAVSPTSLFRIASLSKHITATAIMRLVQDGKLSLGASVAGLLGLSTAADPRLAGVTVLRLLQHTGGWDSAISMEGDDGCVLCHERDRRINRGQVASAGKAATVPRITKALADLFCLGGGGFSSLCGT